ncbi:hypothetical protein O181_128935 [Austropuccinia psidii MF-1]|uniref:Uncharacterized protein n=1 Tax=Austropuccinia psidii MF-1 TaxID=1389203 RepID=A0A9Q3Q9H7_9BASI|nr:hypothetical protein [Austropuccinia psidii MF-1]
MRRLLPHRLVISPLYHAYSHTRIGFHTPAQSSPTISMLTHLHPPLDETPTLPSPLLMLPHPRLIFCLDYNPYAATGPSSYASDAALTPPYASSHLPLTILMLMDARLTCLRRCLPSLCLQCPPDMPPMLPTILTLVECLPDMPLTLLTILRLAVPSRHASNTAYHPYARSALPTCL